MALNKWWSIVRLKRILTGESFSTALQHEVLRARSSERTTHQVQREWETCVPNGRRGTRDKSSTNCGLIVTGGVLPATYRSLLHSHLVGRCCLYAAQADRWTSIRATADFKTSAASSNVATICFLATLLWERFREGRTVPAPQCASKHCIYLFCSHSKR